MPPMAAINAGAPFAPSHQTDHCLPLSKLPLLQKMASNDNDKHKMEEEPESSVVRKRLWHTNDDGGDDDSSNSPEEEEKETEDEVSSEETVIPGFMPKPSTHRMHDPGSIDPHIRPRVSTDNQISQI
jgi:hypothetical protein